MFSNSLGGPGSCGGERRCLLLQIQLNPGTTTTSTHSSRLQQNNTRLFWCITRFAMERCFCCAALSSYGEIKIIVILEYIGYICKIGDWIVAECGCVSFELSYARFGIKWGGGGGKERKVQFTWITKLVVWSHLPCLALNHLLYNPENLSVCKKLTCLQNHPPYQLHTGPMCCEGPRGKSWVSELTLDLGQFHHNIHLVAFYKAFNI